MASVPPREHKAADARCKGILGQDALTSQGGTLSPKMTKRQAVQIALEPGVFSLEQLSRAHARLLESSSYASRSRWWRCREGG